MPIRYLRMFSWKDVEELVCGNATIDIDALREHTLFRGLTGDSNLAKLLFQCLEAFSDEDRQRFLRFVWGRSRLPLSHGDWSQYFTVNAVGVSEDMLPAAHTCFFTLDLPPYASFRVLHDKLLYAIHNCTAIDLDFNPSLV